MTTKLNFGDIVIFQGEENTDDGWIGIYLDEDHYIGSGSRSSGFFQECLNQNFSYTVVGNISTLLRLIRCKV